MDLSQFHTCFDTLQSNDFPEEQLMPSSSLYSLYLLHPNTDSKISVKQKSESNHCGSNENDHKGTSNGRTSDSEENIDVLSLDSHSQSKPNTNGLDHHDALFEGMPFYELKGREVGEWITYDAVSGTLGSRHQLKFTVFLNKKKYCTLGTKRVKVTFLVFYARRFY